MAQAPLTPTGSDPGERPAHPPTPGMPRWVKVLVLLAVVLIAVFVVLQVAGVGGRHGPGRHSGTHAAAGASLLGRTGVGTSDLRVFGAAW